MHGALQMYQQHALVVVFSIQHCMSCKKGGFISIRQSILRNLTTKMLSKVCKCHNAKTEIEPRLTPLMGKELTDFQTQQMKQDLTLEHVESGKEDSKLF